MKKYLLVFPLITLLGFSIVGCKQSEESASDPSKTTPPATSAEAPVPAGPAVELKLKWPVGARYVQRMDLAQKQETTLAGMPNAMKQDVEMSQEFGLTVLSAKPDGEHEIEMEFLGMQMNVSSGERTLVSFDSHGESLNAGNDPMTALFRSLTGTRFKFIMDADNEVVRLEGLQEFRNRVMTNSPALARGQMAQMLSEDYFKQMINFGQGLPKKPVTIGESWPVQTEIAMGPMGIMVLDMEYVFKGWEERDKRKCALMDFNGLIKNKPGREAASPNMKMEITDGKTTGQSWFDPELGMVIGAVINQDINMTMEFSAPNPTDAAAPAATKSLTTKMEQKITITITPEAPKTEQ